MSNSPLVRKIFAVASSIAMAVSALAFAPTTAFAAAHAVGTNVNASGTIWSILPGPCRAAYTSAGAFLSYGFNSFAGVVDANADDLALAQCTPAFIPPAPGTIIFSDRGADRGTGYFMALDGSGGVQRRGFTSASVFTGLGFNFANGSFADVSWMASGSNIDSASMQHPAGSLVNKAGTVYFVGNSGLIGIPDVATFNSWGMSFNNTVPANAADNALTQVGVLASRMAGQLVPSLTTTTPPPVAGDCTLAGGAGSLEDAQLISSLSNEEVGEGEDDVKVAGLEVEADDGSDIRLTAVRVNFDLNTAVNDNFDEFATDVSLWLGSTEVARVDADKFNDDNAHDRTISLTGCPKIMSDATANLYVAVSGINNLDSDDEGDTWDVTIESLRFVDAQGASTTDDATGDLPALRTFSFETFATSADVELKLSLNEDDDAINEAHVIDIDDVDDTDDEVLLSGILEVKGQSDLTIDDFPVNYDSVGVDLEDAISAVHLIVDGDEVGSENVPAGAGTDETIIFDDLDLTLDTGKHEFQVTSDLQSIADGIVDGDTVRAQVTAVERAAIDVEDEEGEDLAAGDRTGTAVPDFHALYEAGIMVSFVSASASVTTPGDPATGLSTDVGTFKVNFKATAFDDDMRIDSSCDDEDTIGDAGEGIEFEVSDVSAALVTCSLTSSTSDSEDNADVFEVDEDTTRSFTLTVIVEGDDGLVNVEIESINWGTEIDDTNDNNYIFNLDEFKTDDLFLNVF